MDLFVLVVLIHAILVSGGPTESPNLDQQMAQTIPGCRENVRDASGKVAYVCKGVEGYFPKKLANARKKCALIFDGDGRRVSKQLCQFYDRGTRPGPQMTRKQRPCDEAKMAAGGCGDKGRLPGMSSARPEGRVAITAATNADNSFMFVSMLILLCLLAYGVLRSIPIIIFNQRRVLQPQV